MWELLSHNLQPQLLQWGVAICASLAAAVWDAKQRRIPNALTFPLFGLGLCSGLWRGGAWGLFESFAAAILMGGPFVVLFILGKGGAGDAKIMAALGAWLGVAAGVVALLSVLTVGAAGGLFYALISKQFSGVAVRMWRTFQGLLMFFTPLRKTAKTFIISAHHEGVAMPYGLAVFGGTFLAAVGVQIWLRI